MEMINDVTKALAYMSGMLADAAWARICSSVLSWSATHFFMKRAGEYQSPPSMKITMAATRTAR